jgi:hypothetical protein
MNNLEQKMYEDAKAQYEEIYEMEVGSEAHSKAIAGANSIVDRLNESRRIKLEEAKVEVERKKAYLEERKVEIDKKDRWIKIGKDVGIFAITLGTTIAFNLLYMGFEMGNTHSTKLGQDAQRKLMGMFNIKA